MKLAFGLRGNKLTAGHVSTVIIPAYICFGYLNAVSSGIVGRESWVTQFPQLDTVNTTGAVKSENSRIEGTVVALFNLGCLFSAIGCIFVGDILGRKRTFMLGLVITIIGSILQSTAFTMAHLIVGRLVTGLGFGAVTATGPNWQSETTAPGLRGFVVMLQSAFLAIGLALAGWLEYGLAFTESSVVWRLPLAFPAFLCLVSLIFAPFWPESPRWLIKAGRIDEAREIIAVLIDEPTDSDQVIRQIEEVEQSLQETGEGSFKDIFRNGPSRFGHRALIAIATQMAQQICGQNAITFYQSTIFQEFLGMTGDMPLLMSAVLYSWKILISPFGALTVDKAGRRKLLIPSFVGMGICMAVMGGCISQKNNKAASDTAVAFIFIYVFFYVTGCIGLTYLYCSEIAPLAVRTQITGMSTASSWTFNFLVVEVTPDGFSSLGWKYFIVYAAINLVLLVPMVYFFFPETRGLHLEGIDNIFLESKNIWHPVRAARKLRTDLLLHGQTGQVEDDDKKQEAAIFQTIINIINPSNHSKEASSRSNMPFLTNFALPGSAQQLDVPEHSDAALFLVFVSSKDPATRQPWCPDVRAAWPTITETFSGEDSPRLGVVEVGQKPEWRDPQNIYRAHWKVNCVPALVRYQRVRGEVVETGRLVEGEILNQEKLRKFIGSSR
ncbi:hypothetical protein BO78DRAFT_429284 [Aspergillus sclerotiicarbonarius CBS 121057]|uniref:Major facilitator superfamily (MFS) profile domain-containing protein n=1 Tax=Aspergillus sclerotiicarbonarius (strain CBS 121057 / IBT 28362) TaxID=1448318 RepID=A0A319EA78_ASPSB|nr:hypothetical protein BO78DRAFT_429284 [Aspergillus sclerotiicarbonarius CBS 121057]